MRNPGVMPSDYKPDTKRALLWRHVRSARIVPPTRRREGMTIRVVIVEDDAVLRDRYFALIASTADMKALWTASSVASARQALNASSAESPDVLLIDLGLPDGSGLAVIAEAKRRYPACEIMVVSIFGDEDNVVAAIESGASGYLLKDTLADAFLATIRELCNGGSPISPSIARIVLNRARQPATGVDKSTPAEAALGQRESQILGLVAKGFNFEEISGLLSISSNTVKTHIYRVYRKLSVHSRCEAVFEAKKMGLLDF